MCQEGEPWEWRPHCVRPGSSKGTWMGFSFHGKLLENSKQHSGLPLIFHFLKLPLLYGA